MKKGCVIALGIFVVLVGIGVWKISGLIKKGMAFAEELQALQVEIQQQTDELNAQYAFTEPDPPAISTGQMEKYLTVRKKLNNAIADSQFYQNMKKMEAMEEQQQDPSWSDLTGLFESMAPSLNSILETYFSSLEEQKLSPQEYYYVSGITTSVISIELAKGNFNEEIPDELSHDLRKLMLDAEENNSRLYRYKQTVQNLEEQQYNQLVEAIKPYLSEFDTISRSFYFDAFIMELMSDTNMAASPTTDSPQSQSE